jgi:hypothetical protein
MTPDALASLLTDLARAAEVVEAIEDADLQRRRGWNLSLWRYDLVPWGVRFRYRGDEDAAEVVATLDPREGPRRMTVRLAEGTGA